MWMDFDFEGGTCKRGGANSKCKTLPHVVAEASKLFDKYAVPTGQIGLYESYGGGEFFGYVIKYPNAAPYFEPAPADANT